jgi:phosphatidylethanolamine/phosphatidyl-N-methylethanolamine N-methyltransferase
MAISLSLILSSTKLALARITKNWRFVAEFLRNPNSVGAILPSSKLLARRILSSINFSDVSVIVEFGSGTGVFTREISKRIKQGTVFLAFETNPTFSALLRREFHDLNVVEHSAVELVRVLQEKNISGVDVIISGLPFALFDAELQENIIRASADALIEGGTFRAFAYVQGQLLTRGRHFRSIINKYFANVTKTGLVWMNMPPAFVYVCRKGSKPTCYDQKAGG